MNNYILIAGLLCFLLGLVHSFLGEFLIFKNRKYNNSASSDGAGIAKRHWQIIWATWHLATLFGWCIGFMLIKISAYDLAALDPNLLQLIYATAGTMLISSVLVAVSTRGKHPGWIVLLIIALLLWFGT